MDVGVALLPCVAGMDFHVVVDADDGDLPGQFDDLQQILGQSDASLFIDFQACGIREKRTLIVFDIRARALRLIELCGKVFDALLGVKGKSRTFDDRDIERFSMSATIELLANFGGDSQALLGIDGMLMCSDEKQSIVSPRASMP